MVHDDIAVVESGFLCGACEAPLPVGAAFCGECGTPVADTADDWEPPSPDRFVDGNTISPPVSHATLPPDTVSPGAGDQDGPAATDDADPDPAVGALGWTLGEADDEVTEQPAAVLYADPSQVEPLPPAPSGSWGITEPVMGTSASAELDEPLVAEAASIPAAGDASTPGSDRSAAPLAAAAGGAIGGAALAGAPFAEAAPAAAEGVGPPVSPTYTPGASQMAPKRKPNVGIIVGVGAVARLPVRRRCDRADGRRQQDRQDRAGREPDPDHRVGGGGGRVEHRVEPVDVDATDDGGHDDAGHERHDRGDDHALDGSLDRTDHRPDDPDRHDADEPADDRAVLVADHGPGATAPGARAHRGQRAERRVPIYLPKGSSFPLTLQSTGASTASRF